MDNAKVMKRWYVVAGSVVIQLCLGAIYAWSVFTPYLVKSGWTRGQTQAVFAVGLALFAVIMVVAGRLMPAVGPRKLAIAGGITLGAGYILGGLMGAANFWSLFFFVGVVGGSGIGLAYVVPIAVGMRWFPDKKGMITGLAVTGFGFGAMLWVKLAGSWGHLLSNIGPDMTFIVYGIIFTVAIVSGGIFMVFPPAGWSPDSIKKEEGSPEVEKTEEAVDFKSAEMLSTHQFYMIFLTFMFGASAGLMSIGLMKLFPGEALIASGINPAKASAIAGTAMAIFFSLANGLGRICWGIISDRLGRKKSVMIMMGTQGIIVILFQWMAGSEYLLYLGATIIGFNFGGNFSLFPTITADTFGAKNVAQNYGWVFLAYGIGGIFGPMLGGKLGDAGNFPLAFTLCGFLCLFAAVLICFVHAPQKDQLKTEISNFSSLCMEHKKILIGLALLIVILPLIFLHYTTSPVLYGKGVMAPERPYHAPFKSKKRPFGKLDLKIKPVTGFKARARVIDFMNLKKFCKPVQAQKDIDAKNSKFSMLCRHIMNLSGGAFLLGWKTMSDEVNLEKLETELSSEVSISLKEGKASPELEKAFYSECSLFYLIPANPSTLKAIKESIKRKWKVINIEGDLISLKDSQGNEWKSSRRNYGLKNRPLKIIWVEKLEIEPY